MDLELANTVDHALLSLAGMCDGARSRDGTGFCRLCLDGHELARIPMALQTTKQQARSIAICLHHAEQAGIAEQAPVLRAALAALRADRAESLKLCLTRDGATIPSKYAGWCAARLEGCEREVPVGGGALCKDTAGKFAAVCPECALQMLAKAPAPEAPAPVDPATIQWTRGSNRYDGPCLLCGENVPAGTGRLGRTPGGKWVTAHHICPGRAPEAPATNDAPLAVDFGSIPPAPRFREAQTSAPEQAPASLVSYLRPETLAALESTKHQVAGVQWLAARQRGLLADEMGLGKTIQALCAIPPGFGALVVGPLAAQGVWDAECARWRPELGRCTVDRAGFRWPRANEVVIARWSSLPVDNLEQPETLRGIERAKAVDAALVAVYGSPTVPMVLIADEAHYAKSREAQRHQAFRSISRIVRLQGGKVFLLTGTPMLNRPDEVWNILATGGLAEEAFGSLDNFRRIYGIGKNRWGGMTYSSNGGPAARECLSRVMLRRKAEDVLSLPPIVRDSITVPLSPEAAAECDELLAWAGGEAQLVDLVEEMLAGRAGLKGQELIRKLSRMRAAVAASKVPALLPMIAGNEPIAVFSEHRAPVEVLKARPDFVTITGDEDADAKYEAARNFQDGEDGVRGIAYTLAGCECLTLTRAARLIVVSPNWTPARNRQAEARLWRYGQKNTVRVTYLVGDHFVEQMLHKALLRKLALLDGSGLAASGDAK